MGKKYKKSKKVQWRRLSINESSNKSSEDGCIEEGESVSEEQERNNSPQPQSRPLGPPTRKPFQPNFYPGDQRRFHHPFEYGPRRGFERGISVERFSHPRYFRGGRPFCPDARQGPPFPGSPFQGARRPYKFFGRGSFYVRGASPYGREGGLRRRWSQDEGLCYINRDEDDDIDELGERLSQPVHTVLINNEQYTKIQTPRQEVIFKKSCLERKCYSLDVDYDPSLAGSSATLEHGSRESPGDHGSMTGSFDESCNSPGSSREETQQHDINHRIHSQYDVSASIFVGDPGAPPLAGVVMQQSFPGGPMISIPVHWTPFLGPGLIPGDTALTTLDPAFTHVLDPKVLPVDPTHILPVQHDANGCPVTVQVKVDADGVPIEIEPNAFTVSLNTLERHQQEVLFNRTHDYHTYTPQIQVPPGFQTCHKQEVDLGAKREEIPHEDINNKCESESRRDELGTDSNEDCAHDSQYASMSEPSTAPTTPSGELFDHCDSNSVDSNFDSVHTSKSPNNESVVQSPKESRRVSFTDSLHESETQESDPYSSNDPFDDCARTTKPFSPACVVFVAHKLPSSTKNDPDSSHHNDDVIARNLNNSSHLAFDSLSQCSTCESQTSTCHDDATQSSCCHVNLDSTDSCCHTQTSDSDAQALSLGYASSSPISSNIKNIETKKKEKRTKKLRSSSIDSDYSYQMSPKNNLKLDEKNETTSKYQAKREAKKLKKEKKRSSKDKNKAKGTSAKNLSKSDEHILNAEEDKEERPVTELILSDRVSEKSNFEFPESNSYSCSASDCSPKDIMLNELDSTTSEHETVVQNFASNEVSQNHQNTTSDSLKDDAFSQTESSKLINGSNDEVVINENNSEDKLKTDLENCSSIIHRGLAATINTEKIEKDSDTLQGNTEDGSESHADIEDNFETTNTENEETENGFTCKPGYIMVPILTPYYDPAVLYGYHPVVMPDNSIERNYIRKKKKKFRKKYQDHHLSLPLDTELYVGETFVATPNGYMVPVDSSQLCQVHGYQYNHNMYSHHGHDEGFVSLEHSPYLPEIVPEQMYHKNYYYNDHAYQPSFSRLHEVERKQIEEILEQHPKEDQIKSLPVDSADSGVSESEEPGVVIDAESKVTIEKSDLAKPQEIEAKKDNVNEEIVNENQAENAQKAKIKKEKAKKKLKMLQLKTKKPVIEIEEPDFSSFSGTTLRFEVKRENVVCSTKNDLLRNSKLDSNVKDVKLKNKKPRNKKSKRNSIPEGTIVAKENTETDTTVIDQTIVTDVTSVTDENKLQERNIVSVSEVTEESNGKSSLLSKNLLATKHHENKLPSPNNVNNDKTCSSDSKLLPKMPISTSKLSSDTEENSNENETKKKRNRKKKEKNKSKVTEEEPSKLIEAPSQRGTKLVSPIINDVLTDPCSFDLAKQCSADLTSSQCETENNSQSSTDITSYPRLPAIEATSRCIVEDSKTSPCYSEVCPVLEIVETDTLLEINQMNDETRIITEEYCIPVSSTTEIETALADLETPNSDLTAIVLTRDFNDFKTETEDSLNIVKISNDSSCSLLNDCLAPVLEEKLPYEIPEEKMHLDVCSNTLMENSTPPLCDTNSFKDLGVTEAVMKWMSEISPEKVFSLSDERRSLLFNELFLSPEDPDSEDEIPLEVSDSKNVESNPLVVMSSKKALDECSERVATFHSNQRAVSIKYNRSISLDIIDDYDGESVISDLSRDRLYSSSSSSSNLATTAIEEPSILDDPRVYDPSVYSKYYQLGADVRITPSNSTANSSRESTLAPSLPEREGDCEAVFDHLSLSPDLQDLENVQDIVNYILPSHCEDSTVPICDSPVSSLQNEKERIRDPLSSLSSSGIGSSLASTPVNSPAHEPIYQLFTQRELQLNQLQNLSGENILLPHKASCSIM